MRWSTRKLAISAGRRSSAPKAHRLSRKQRWPTPCSAQPSELQVHLTVVSYLRHCAAHGAWWFHPANGELRDARTAAKLKSMGVKAGTPDLLLLHQGRLFALELKRPGGRLSPAQIEARTAIEAAGGHWACAWGVDEALTILRTWGLLRIQSKRVPA